MVFNDKMLYNADNRDKWLYDAEHVHYFHDGDMVFLDYDRANRIVVMQITNYYYHTKHRLTFREVRLFFSTAFDVWGHCDDRILGMEAADIDNVVHSLKALMTFKQSDITTAEKETENMLGARFLFAAGHELFILSETIEVREIAPPKQNNKMS